MEWWWCFVGAGTCVCFIVIATALFSRRDARMSAHKITLYGTEEKIVLWLGILAWLFISRGAFFGTFIWLGFYLAT